MKELFPVPHVIGFVSSLLLSLIALVVIKFDLSFGMGMTILGVTAIIQACLQLFLFMHVGENENKTALLTNIGYALFVGLVTIFGTLFAMMWGYQML
ncbi:MULTISPECIES: cytochrome aa3 quinol oxidase subunit IV [Sporosarcina]|uniref:Quinol oxidase subunit 4 n=2 Tax=Sporosarcina newyorkensis TaxID=759851 RepID=A0A1T4XSL0_9BACL|nr:cytochrome aa3 quinol oxidase subunit IV [Sporosarcina newyorkensis]EGQ22113.1 cytochrome aa3 quinol oxidase subunit IV [Sporosarcina newyorkensis 2681]SKA92540.1 cytochrome aa3-600 menaquinol oxidase subunit 4 [Sporosarcina newyorkensis]